MPHVCTSIVLLRLETGNPSTWVECCAVEKQSQIDKAREGVNKKVAIEMKDGTWIIQRITAQLKRPSLRKQRHFHEQCAVNKPV
jgi:hypothetical protein